MGFVKDMYTLNVMDDYNEEYFYLMEDDYMEEVSMDAEYQAMELTHAVELLKEISQDSGISCDEAVAALNDFIYTFERYYEIH